MNKFLKIIRVFCRLKKEEFLAYDWEYVKYMSLIITVCGLIGLLSYRICYWLSLIFPVFTVDDIFSLIILTSAGGAIFSFILILVKRFIYSNWQKALQEVNDEK